MTKNIFLPIIVFMLCASACTYAQVTTPSDIWYLVDDFSGAPTLPYAMNMTDPEYNSGAGPIDTKDRQILSYVKIGLDNKINKECYPHRKYTFEVDITYEKWNGTSMDPPASVAKIFEIEYDPTNTTPYKESAAFYFKDAYNITAEITAFTVYDYATSSTLMPVGTLADLPGNLYLEITSDAERYEEMDIVTSPSLNSVSYSSTDNEVTFAWSVIPGSTDIELEWTFVDDFNADPVLTTPIANTALEFTFTNNATRVRIPASATSYTIPAMYDRGYIVARIRGVGRDYNNDLNFEIRTPWSHPQNFNQYEFVSAVSSSARCSIPPFQTVNWMSSATFAEEGKNKFVVSYADGSSRVRQQVTLSSTENIAIATETYYDHQGRAAVQSLPSPVFHLVSSDDTYEDHIQYYYNLNLNTSGTKYSRANFDLDAHGGLCYPSTGAFEQTYTSGVSGAGHYYSLYNEITPEYQAYVADAAGYPFTVTQFTPDNTGRIARQSGVGINHMIGTGHETQYFYGTPSQVELNRLFGTDAGYSNFYQKNMVMDANGQISVSYIDMAGKTVATSLAGDPPNSVSGLRIDGLPVPGMDGVEVTEDLLNKTVANPLGMNTVISSDSMAITVSYGFLVSSPQVYELDYSVEVVDFADECVEGICIECTYDLTISVKDRCGDEKLDGGEYTLRIGGQNGEWNWDATCDYENSYTPATLVTETLQPGEYTVSKTLRIVESALEYYADSFYTNTTCIPDFYIDPEVDCNMTCESCTTKLAAMGTLEEYLTEQADGQTLSASDIDILTSYYNSVVNLCSELCEPPSLDNCEVLHNMLMLDMSPGGQYGTYEIDPATSEISFPDELSIFDDITSNNNNPNHLPWKYKAQFLGAYPGTNFPETYITPTWRKPLYYQGNGMFEEGYFNEDGVRVKVYLEINEDIASPDPYHFIPAVPPGLVTYDAVSDRYYTYPENLSNVSDFIEIFTISFSQSLIVYHPEFFAYDWCSGKVYNDEEIEFDDMSVQTLNSNQFDYFLQTVDYSNADDLFGTNFDIALYDPLAIQCPPCSTLLAEKLDEFTPMPIILTVFTAAESAYIGEHYTGNRAISPVDINDYLHDLSTGICLGTCDNSEVIVGPNEWERYKQYYLSAKSQVIIQKTFEYTWEYPIHNNFFCIGRDFPAIGVSLPYSDPCGLLTKQLYIDKVSRFIDPKESANETVGAEEDDEMGEVELELLADYQHFVNTGECPLARDVEGFFVSLVRDNILATTSTVNLLERQYLPKKLYNLLYDGSPPLNYLPTITGGTVWTWDFPLTTNLTSCSTPLTLNIPPGLPSYVTFDNITDIFDIHEIVWDGTNGYSTFKIKVYVTNGSGNSEMFVLNGRVCLDLLTCTTVDDVEQCKVGEVPKSILSVMNALNADDLLDGSAVDLTPYESVLDPEIRLLLGSGTLYWTYSATGPVFTIDKGTSTPNITINITNTGTADFSVNTNTFYKRIYSADPQIQTTSGTPATSFKIDFFQSGSPLDPAVFYPGSTIPAPTGTIEGNITYDLGGGSTDLSITECGPIPNIACNAPENQNLRSLEELLNDAIFYSNAVDVNMYYDDLPCLPDLVLESTNGTPDFTLISYIIKITPDISQAFDGINTYYFKAMVRMDNGVTDFITGRYCHPIRSCDIICNDCDPEETVVLDLTLPVEIDLFEGGSGITITLLTNDCFGISPHSYFIPTPGISDPPVLGEDVISSWAALIEANTPGIDVVANDNHMQLTIPTASLPPGCECNSNKSIAIAYAYGDQTGNPPPPWHEPVEDITYIPITTDDISCCQAIPTPPCYPSDSLTLVFDVDTTIITPGPPYNFLSARLAFTPMDNTCIEASLGLTDLPVFDPATEKYKDYLNDVIAILDNDVTLNATLSGKVITLRVPTSILSTSCSCSSNATIYARWYQIGIVSAYAYAPAASANINCCQANLAPSPCSATVQELEDEYQQELDDLQTAFDSLFTLWMNDCGDDPSSPACTTSLAALYADYDSDKAALDSYYQPLIEDAHEECLTWADPGSIQFLQCEKNIEPFPQWYEPYVDNCANDMIALAEASARYDTLTYLINQRNAFKRRLRNHCLTSAVEAFTMHYEVMEYHFTLYYYDQAGNLYRTVPPKAVTPIDNPTTLADINTERNTGLDETGFATPILPDHANPTEDPYDYVTEYRFNSLNQPIAQHTPDGGDSKFWYDELGRLVYSQNAKQAPADKYSYTRFDAQGRITQVGQLTNPEGIGAYNIYTLAERVDWESWITAGSYEQVTYTVYDVGIGQNLRKRVSRVLYYDDLDADPISGTIYSYDILGNVKQLTQINTDMPTGQWFKTMYYYYDLVSGKVNGVAYQPDGPDRFFHKYKYDADNRLVAAYTWQGAEWADIEFEDTDWGNAVMPVSRLEHVFQFDEDARYFYYHHGPLARTEIGEMKVQGVDFMYTLQGWIKGVNSTTLRVDRDPGIDGEVPASPPVTPHANRYVARDAFSYSLDYFDGDYYGIGPGANSALANLNASGYGDFKYLYNGNIAAMATTLRQPGTLTVLPQGMAYEYDQLNRLVDAHAFQALDVSGNDWNNESALTDYRNAFEYDPNGNILKQLRNGHNSVNTNLDSLQYFYYPGTNKLAYVNDNVSAGNYADDIDDQTSPTNYEYDAIGNLVQDSIGDIDNIDWTVYGKIKFIDKGTGDDITFTYAPDGNRISKLTDTRNTYYVRDASGNIMATYTLIDDCLTLDEHPLYGSSRLGVRQKEVCMDDVPTTDPDYTGIVYVERGWKKYELSNHLGNVLTVITDRRSCYGTDDEDLYYEPDIVTITDYYPFGSPMEVRTDNQPGYRFGFNGKENDNETYDTGNALDFDARIYDSRLGRWLGKDPSAFKTPYSTPYSFCGNNPILFKDLDGKDYIIEIVGDQIIIKANFYTDNNEYINRAVKDAIGEINSASGKYIFYDEITKKEYTVVFQLNYIENSLSPQENQQLAFDDNMGNFVKNGGMPVMLRPKSDGVFTSYVGWAAMGGDDIQLSIAEDENPIIRDRWVAKYDDYRRFDRKNAKHEIIHALGVSHHAMKSGEERSDITAEVVGGILSYQGDDRQNTTFVVKIGKRKNDTAWIYSNTYLKYTDEKYDMPKVGVVGATTTMTGRVRQSSEGEYAKYKASNTK